ncbi:MAG: ACT domain-containing protein [Phycisphaerales bacterium]|nr:MAG: ACT domain-containing protein [Phycisphaerales bacterium]
MRKLSPGQGMPMVTLHQQPGRYAVCRLSPADAVPDWVGGQGLVSITRTDDELSIVCPEARVPADCRAERDWRCLSVEGPLPFDAIGVLASLATPLAKRGISIFVISTHDTDHLLVKDDQLREAINTLIAAGHAVQTPADDE